MATFLVQGKRYFRQTESYALAQQEASKVIRITTQDLYRASTDHLTVEPSQFYLLSSIPEPDGAPIEFDPAGGGVLWHRWVGFYHDTEAREIYRATIPLDSPTSDPGTLTGSLPGFPDFKALEAPQSKRIGEGIEALEFVIIDPGLMQMSVTTRFNRIASQTENYLSAGVSLESQIRVLETK